MGAVRPAPTLAVTPRGGALHRPRVGYDDGSWPVRSGQGSRTERFSTTSGLSELIAFVGQVPSETSSAGREQTVAELIRALADDPDVTRFQRPDEWPQLRTCWHPGWAAARTRPATALRTALRTGRVLLIGVRHHE